MGLTVPNTFPRTDLVAVFLGGIPGVNNTGTLAEMLRLNTALPATARIVLRLAVGYLLPPAQAPVGQLPLVDGAFVYADHFDDVFPYLRTPLSPTLP